MCLSVWAMMCVSPDGRICQGLSKRTLAVLRTREYLHTLFITASSVRHRTNLGGLCELLAHFGQLVVNGGALVREPLQGERVLVRLLLLPDALQRLLQQLLIKENRPATSTLGDSNHGFAFQPSGPRIDLIWPFRPLNVVRISQRLSKPTFLTRSSCRLLTLKLCSCSSRSSL